MLREEAIEIIRNYDVNGCGYCHQGGGEIEEAFGMAIKALEQEPKAKPKTGYWIKTISENGVTSAVRCSECGFEDNQYMLFRYCPNCGAKMDKHISGKEK